MPTDAKWPHGAIQFHQERSADTLSLAREITISVACGFLVEAANLRYAVRETRRFLRKFRVWLSPLFPLTMNGSPPGTVSATDVSSLLSVGAVLSGGNPLYVFAEMLRAAWRQPTPIERQLGILKLEHDILTLETQGRQTIHATGLRLLLLQAIGLADRMAVCGNAECAAPYFIATRETQKYCGEDCAAPAQRAYKRNWWKQHGKEWSKERKRGKQHATSKDTRSRSRRG